MIDNMKARFKPKYNIRKGDNVVVITGNDKDLSKPRVVKEVLVDEAKVLVEGVNIKTKHTKPSAQNTKGGILKVEAPIHISRQVYTCALLCAPRCPIGHAYYLGRR